ncbi:MAG: hypothetical protein ABFS56_33630 [Pseudomonadota bacterium]
MKKIIWTILAFISITIILPIITNVISELIYERINEPPPPIKEDLPKSTIMLSFWLDSIGKTQFNRNQAVVCYYKVDGTTNQPLFFSLFNRTSNNDTWLPMLKNEPIEIGKLYSFPPPLSTSENVTQGNKLYLETGTEYFKAIVSAKPDEILTHKKLMIEIR